MLVPLSWYQIDATKYFGVLHGTRLPLAFYNGLRLMPTPSPDSLVSPELEGQIFRCQAQEEVRRIERLAWRKSTMPRTRPSRIRSTASTTSGAVKA